MLQLQDLSFAYGQHPVLRALNATITPGVTLVQGGDGSGKTTLLRLLAGDLAPDAGRILGPRIGTWWHNPRAGDPPQPTPRAWLTAQVPLWGHWNMALLHAHVDGFALDAHLDKPWEALSAGSRRKVMLAAALSCAAPLLLIDEPTAALDAPSIRHLCEALCDLAEGPACVVVADYLAPPGVPLAGLIDLDRA